MKNIRKRNSWTFDSLNHYAMIEIYFVSVGLFFTLFFSLAYRFHLKLSRI